MKDLNPHSIKEMLLLLKQTNNSYFVHTNKASTHDLDLNQLKKIDTHIVKAIEICQQENAITFNEENQAQLETELKRIEGQVEILNATPLGINYQNLFIDFMRIKLVVFETH